MNNLNISEHEEQKALLRMCRLHQGKYPELALLHAIPNGGKRHIAIAAKLKAEGVKAGIPDLFLPVPRGGFHGLYIEMKAKGGKLSQAQRGMLFRLREQGYSCLVAYGWKDAWDAIRNYLLRDGT